jgi:hypothetical protein
LSRRGRFSVPTVVGDGDEEISSSLGEPPDKAWTYPEDKFNDTRRQTAGSLDRA